MIQSEKGRLLFNIQQSLNDKERSILESEIRKYFNGDMEYRIHESEELRTDKGKLRDFISTIS